MIHLEGGYQHNLRAVLFNDGQHYYGHGAEFGPKAISEAQWRTQYNIDRNADIYPTHGVGPLMHYANINYGNRFTNLVFRFRQKPVGCRLMLRGSHRAIPMLK